MILLNIIIAPRKDERSDVLALTKKPAEILHADDKNLDNYPNHDKHNDHIHKVHPMIHHAVCGGWSYHWDSHAHHWVYRK